MQPAEHETSRDRQMATMMQENTVGNGKGPCASKVLRFGLVGAGMVSGVHAQSLLECDDAKLTVVFSRSEARAKKFGEKYAVDWTTDLDRVLQCPDLDAVILTTAPYNHAPQAIAAMRAGKHVLVEKPMAVS
ncbi:MAG: Gfo/Idh/MocA family oxidoreductase, partial [Pirellulales bacterium]|nr:Gfo/Idh/MocA family oxidoreductase [Pirellulales bacterium]